MKSLDNYFVSFVYSSKTITMKYSDFSKRTNFPEILKLPHSFLVDFPNIEDNYFSLAVDEFVEYINSGNINISQETALHLLCLSYEFYAYRLSQECSNFVQKNISVKYITEFIAFRLSQKMSISALEDYVFVNIKSFIKNPDFFKLPEDFILNVFRKMQATQIGKQTNNDITPDEFMESAIEYYQISNYNINSLNILQFLDLNTVSINLLQSLHSLLSQHKKPYPYFNLINSILVEKNEISHSTSDEIQKFHLEARLKSLFNTLHKVTKGDNIEAYFLLAGLYKSGNLNNISEEQILANFLNIAEATNDPESYYEVAQRYSEGVGTLKNISKAEFYYEKASKLGHIESKIALSHKIISENHEKNINSPQPSALQLKPQKEFELILEGAKLGDPKSLFYIAKFYKDGYGVKKSFLDSSHYYQLASISNYMDAQIKFNEMSSLNNAQTEKEAKKAVQKIISQISQIQPLIQNFMNSLSNQKFNFSLSSLFFILSNAINHIHNKESKAKISSSWPYDPKVLYQLKLSADSEFVPGMILYIITLFIFKKYKEAKEYCNRLYQKGYIEGIILKSHIYIYLRKFSKAYNSLTDPSLNQISNPDINDNNHSISSPQNDNEHLNLQENAEALMELSLLYKNGWGVGKSEQDYWTIMNKAAIQGNEQAAFYIARKNNDLSTLNQIANMKGVFSKLAKFEIGKLQFYGTLDGNPQISRAAATMKELSDGQLSEASYFYGKILFHGNGIQRDFTTSLNYFTKSLDNGYIPAVTYIAQLYHFLGNQYEMKLKQLLFDSKYINDSSMRYKNSIMNHLYEDMRQSSDGGSICGMFIYGLELINQNIFNFYQRNNKYLFLKNIQSKQEVETNYFEAMRLFLKAGLQGLDTALYFYAINALKFKDLENEGVYYLKQLSLKGHVPSRTAYAIYLFENKQYGAALPFLRTNAYLGESAAEYYYAKVLMLGQIPNVTNQQSFDSSKNTANSEIQKFSKNDASMAQIFYRISSSKDYQPSLVSLINLFQKLDDRAQLESLLKKKMKQNSFVMYKSASLYFSNYFDKPFLSSEMAIDLLKLSSLCNDSDGLWKFGTFLRDGFIVAQNKEQAFEHFKASAQLGNPNGKCCLANMLIQCNHNNEHSYEFKLFSEKQQKDAINLLKASHEEGSLTGSWCFANILKTGLNPIVEQDQFEALKIFMKLSNEHNDKDSQYEVFKLLMNGVRIKMNNAAFRSLNSSEQVSDGFINKTACVKHESKALEYLVRAANNGHSTAQWRLGELLLEGNTIKKNEKAGIHFIKMSAEANNSHGIWLYSRCLVEGRGVKKDLKQATKYLEMLCKNDDHEAEFMYGSILIDELNNLNDGVKYITKSAKNGNSNGLWKLGELYMNGTGVDQDFNKAKDYLKESIQKGNNTAIFKLSLLYILYLNNDSKLKKGSELLQKAAKLGQIDARMKLAYIYSEEDPLTSKISKYIPHDKQKAIELFKKIAEDEKNAEAMFMYGKLTNNLDYISKSASLGNNQARIFYGKMAQGKENLAAYYFKFVADSGNPEAQYLFGMCLKNGNGIPKDKKNAYEYFKKSATSLSKNSYKSDAIYEYAKATLKNDKDNGMKIMTDAMNEGNVDALFKIGKINEDAETISKAAEKGSKKAIIFCAKQIFLNEIDPSTNSDVYILDLLKKISSNNKNIYLKQSATLDGECSFNFAFYLKNNINQSFKFTDKDFFQYIFQSYHYGYKKQAASILGALYLEGIGTEKDPTAAIDLFNKTIEYNDAFGINCLGYCYYTGNGVRSNSRNAVHFFKTSAEKGDPSGLSNYGLTFYEGKGSEKNIQNAIKYFEMAANKGSQIGFENLKKSCKKHNIEKDDLFFQGIEDNMVRNRSFYFMELSIPISE